MNLKNILKWFFICYKKIEYDIKLKMSKRIEDMSKLELILIAKNRKLTEKYLFSGYSKTRKADLIEVLTQKRVKKVIKLMRNYLPSDITDYILFPYLKVSCNDLFELRRL